VKDLTSSDRASCGGLGCAKAHRLVSESEGRNWITVINGVMPLAIAADKGPVLASFDTHALAHQINLTIYVTMGVASY
jgi:hypothetical protein